MGLVKVVLPQLGISLKQQLLRLVCGSSKGEPGDEWRPGALVQDGSILTAINIGLRLSGREIRKPLGFRSSSIGRPCRAATPDNKERHEASRRSR